MKVAVDPDVRGAVKRTAKTRAIAIPRVDFADIRAGRKQEWRAYGHRFTLPTCPVPAVGWCRNPVEGLDTFLFTLDDIWVEPMGAISPESLAREGFADLGEFRRYITLRYPNGGFRPLANAVVYRGHPMTPEERDDFRDTLWEHVYGQFA